MENVQFHLYGGCLIYRVTYTGSYNGAVRKLYFGQELLEELCVCEQSQPC